MDREPAAPPHSDHRERRANLGRAGLVSLATLGSRVLGLAREHLFAKLFGAGLIADAFVIAYRIPNLLRELLAEGALSFAFLPVLADVREKRGDAAAFALAQVLFTGLFVLVGGLTLAGYLFVPQLVDTIAVGFHDLPAAEGAQKRQLAIDLTRIMLPFLLLVSWAALCRGLLNTHRRFFLPALSPALFNLVAVLVGYGMWVAGVEPLRAICGWAIATVAGGALQFAVQVPSLWRLGLRFRWRARFRDRDFLRVLHLMAPATLGLAAVQVNIFVNSRIASGFDNGPISMLNYAYRLVYLPIGVIGVAIATVSTVQVSRDAARADRAAFADGVASALRFLVFFTVPGTVGLIILAEPIVRLIYGYGRFADDPGATVHTASTLICYTWALFFLCGVKVLAPAFYALDRIRTPVAASVTAVLLNVAWSLSTHRLLGWQTLAVGTALAGCVNFAILAGALRRELGGTPYAGLAGTFVRVAFLSAPMGALALGANRAIEAGLGVDGVGARAAGTLIPIALAVAAYLTGGRLLGLRECRDLLALGRRRRAATAPARPGDGEGPLDSPSENP